MVLLCKLIKTISTGRRLVDSLETPSMPGTSTFNLSTKMLKILLLDSPTKFSMTYSCITRKTALSGASIRFQT